MNSDTEGMSNQEIADDACLMLENSQQTGDRAISLAIVLRDRLEAAPEQSRDLTGIALAGLLVEILENSIEEKLKEYVTTLVRRADFKSLSKQ